MIPRTHVVQTADAPLQEGPWPLPCTLQPHVGFPSVAAFATRPFVVASFLKWFDIQGFDPAEVCGYTHNIMCSMDLFHIFSEKQRLIANRAAGKTITIISVNFHHDLAFLL